MKPRFEDYTVEMNYPAASQRVSKARQQPENIVGASSGVLTRGAIRPLTESG